MRVKLHLRLIFSQKLTPAGHCAAGHIADYHAALCLAVTGTRPPCRSSDRDLVCAGRWLNKLALKYPDDALKAHHEASHRFAGTVAGLLAQHRDKLAGALPPGRRVLRAREGLGFIVQSIALETRSRGDSRRKGTDRQVRQLWG